MSQSNAADVTIGIQLLLFSILSAAGLDDGAESVKFIAGESHGRDNVRGIEGQTIAVREAG